MCKLGLQSDINLFTLFFNMLFLVIVAEQQRTSLPFSSKEKQLLLKEISAKQCWAAYRWETKNLTLERTNWSPEDPKSGLYSNSKTQVLYLNPIKHFTDG